MHLESTVRSLELSIPAIQDCLVRIAGQLERLADRLATPDENRVVASTPTLAPEWLSIKQAASLAGLSPSKIRREVQAGRLPASNAGTPLRAHYRISRADVVAWMEKNKGGSQLPPRGDIVALEDRYFGSRD